MTPQEVIKTFIATLTGKSYTYSSTVGKTMLDDAVKASSRFLNIQNAIDNMKADQIEAEREAVEEVLGVNYAGKTISEISSSILKSNVANYAINADTYAPSSYATVKRVILERKAYIFLEKYCGIQMNNKLWFYTDTSSTYSGSSGNNDTGAISGADANITLKAGDVVYGTTLTAADLQAFAQQDGASLQADGSLVIGTGVEKTSQSVVPEIGNKYTAASSTAQSISTGSGDWLVTATAANDTIITGGADSIDAGAGNDKITVGADYASILTGAGNDTVEISSAVNNVTLEDLSSTDTLTVNGTFSVGSAQVEDDVLVITDKTGSRVIRIDNYADAKDAKVNSTTLTTWLSRAGFDIDNLEVTAMESVEEETPTLLSALAEDAVGQIEEEGYQPPETDSVSAATSETQDISSGRSNVVDLSKVTITSGSVTAGNTTLGAISSEFPDISTFHKNGLTIKLLGVSTDTSDGNPSKAVAKTLDQLTDDQKTVLGGLFKWWAKEAINLNEDSYDLEFGSSTTKEVKVVFYNGSKYLAAIWGSGANSITLTINMKYYTGIDPDNVDGESSGQGNLDRTLAHEFNHAILGANINYFFALPQFIKEGMAELTHGIDDFRAGRIFEVAADASRLSKVLSVSDTGTGTSDAYAGGYMFLRYLAKQGALQQLVDYANPDEGESWTINKTTATYTVDGEIVATISGLKSGLVTTGNLIDGISVKDGVITLSQKVLGTTKVTLTSDNYTLALADDLADNTVTISNKAWTVKNGTATLKGNATAGYTLASDAKSITYTAAKNNQTLATVSGLAKSGVTADDFPTDSNVITLKSNMLATSKISVSGDGYTLALDSSFRPGMTYPYWSISGTTATYKYDTTAGFTLSTDSKVANYSKAATTTLATVSGLKKGLTASGGSVDGITASGNVITLTDKVLGTSKVTVKGDYTLALADSVTTPVQQTPYWSISGTTATYKQETSATFKLAANGKSATYNKPTTTTLATITGLKKGLTATDGSVDGITLSGDTITLGAKVLGTSKVTVKGDYTLALADDAPTATQQTPYWTVKGTTATYKQDTTESFTVAENGKSATYNKPTTTTLATITGLKKGLTATDGSVDGITLSGDTITLGAKVLGTSKVTVKGDYTLALADDAPTATQQTPYWTVKGTTATYKQDTTESFTVAENGKSVTYNKPTTKTLATITGLKKGLTVTDGAIDGITLSGDTITLTDKVLGTSNVTVKGDYTLALPDSMTTVLNENRWQVNKTTATYDNVRLPYFTVAANGKSATYNKEKVLSTPVSVKGLKSGAKVGEDGTVAGVTLDGTTVTLADDDLFGNKVEVKLADGYTLTSQLTTSTGTATAWTVKKGTATLKQDMTAGYTLTENAKTGVKTLTYSAAKTGKSAVTLATVTGLNSALTDDNGSLSGLSQNLTDKTVIFDNRVLGTSNIVVKGGYTLSPVTGGTYAVPTAAKTDTYWTVSGNKAVYKTGEIGYFTAANDTTLKYTKEKVQETHATISGVNSTATPDSFSISGSVITLAASALVDNPNANTKITLGKKDNYTLQLGSGIANVEYSAPSWTYAKNVATYATAVRTAGYSTSTDGKTITYIPALDSKKRPVSTTLATISGLKSADGIYVSNNVITLSEADLNAQKVTLSTTNDYSLALNSSVATPTLSRTEWSSNNTTTAKLMGIISAGYTVKNAKTITYSPQTTQTLATVKGLADKTTQLGAIGISDKIINLSGSQLGKKVEVSGDYEFNFAGDYNDAAIVASKENDTITCAGSGLSVTGGKGDDYIDFAVGGAGNVFVYASGDGNDVIADFTPSKDKVKVTSGKSVSVKGDGNDVLITVDSGTIKLEGAAGQTISVIVKNTEKEFPTKAASADLLDSDNFLTSDAQIDTITDGSGALDDLNATTLTSTDLTTLTKQNNLITYGKK